MYIATSPSSNPIRDYTVVIEYFPIISFLVLYQQLGAVLSRYRVTFDQRALLGSPSHSLPAINIYSRQKNQEQKHSMLCEAHEIVDIDACFRKDEVQGQRITAFSKAG